MWLRLIWTWGTQTTFYLFVSFLCLSGILNVKYYRTRDAFQINNNKKWSSPTRSKSWDSYIEGNKPDVALEAEGQTEPGKTGRKSQMPANIGVWWRGEEYRHVGRDLTSPLLPCLPGIWPSCPQSEFSLLFSFPLGSKSLEQHLQVAQQGNPWS